MVLVIDNYDSFTYNLVQRLGEIDETLPIEVHRNDQITCDQIAEKRPSHLIVSPGPCTPSEAGISVACIQRFAGKMPILGVCLGHQSIGQATGGVIVRAKRLMHGKTDRIRHDGQGIFAGLPNPLTATRYHSLVIRPDTLKPVMFEFPVTLRSRETVYQLGLTGAAWPEGKAAHPVAWMLVLKSADGRTLAEQKSFLWEKPPK